MGTRKNMKRSKRWAAAEKKLERQKEELQELKKYYRDRALLLKLFRADAVKTSKSDATSSAF